MKAQLAAHTGLGSKLRKELNEAIIHLNESQSRRHEEYQARLEELDPLSENYETKFNQVESELDNIKEEVRSIADVSQEAAREAEIRQIGSTIKSSYDEVIEKKLRVAVNEAFKKYSYDKTGEADFALESGGKFYNYIS